MTKEENLQIVVADYIRLQYPKVLFAHIANERKTSPQRGSKLKRMGVKKGMPDVMVYKHSGDHTGVNFSGLAIELKIKPNRPTKEQEAVLAQLFSNGWFTSVCYSFDEAKEIIDTYLSIPVKR